MNPFSYNVTLDNLSMRLKKQTDTYRIHEVRFDSGIDTGYSRNSTVIGDYYVPETLPAVPLAILVHGMGDYSVLPCRMLAKHLVKQGIACFLPYLSIHSRRLPREMKSNMPYLSPEEWYNVYRVSVVDVRQIIDWAETRPEIDNRKVFISGISFGGFVSSIAMGMDERIKAGVLIVTGGNANKLSWNNKEGKYRKRYTRTESEHFQIVSDYEAYLDQVQRYGFENVPAKHISFLTDPMTFADRLRDRPVLMINAKHDKYIPVESATDLWHSIGRPDIKWFPTGHVTLWLFYHSIQKSITEFFGLFNRTNHS